MSRKKKKRKYVQPESSNEELVALIQQGDDSHIEQLLRQNEPFIHLEDEYVLECQGLAQMDEDELNELVAARDPHALSFFGLTEATDEELEEWDAYDLDEVPTIADFKEDFEPYSPYDAGWTLNVEFVDPNE